jgi:hypothetical protein
MQIQSSFMDISSINSRRSNEILSFLEIDDRREAIVHGGEEWNPLTFYIALQFILLPRRINLKIVKWCYISHTKDTHYSRG